MKKQHYKITPAIYLVLLRNQDTQVLLLKRANTSYMDGMYSLVAGHVEANEMPTVAMIREAKEEAGIDLTEHDLEIGHIMYRMKPSDSRLDIFLVARTWQGEIENKEPEKCSDLSWFPVNKLPDNTIPYIKHGIENCLKTFSYSEFFGD